MNLFPPAIAEDNGVTDFPNVVSGHNDVDRGDQSAGAGAVPRDAAQINAAGPIASPGVTGVCVISDIEEIVSFWFRRGDGESGGVNVFFERSEGGRS